MSRRAARRTVRRKAILSALIDHGGPLTACQITDALGCWPDVICSDLAWLERERLVESYWADEPQPRRRLYWVVGLKVRNAT